MAANGKSAAGKSADRKAPAAGSGPGRVPGKLYRSELLRLQAAISALAENVQGFPEGKPRGSVRDPVRARFG